MPILDFTVEKPLKKVQQLFDSNSELTHENVKKIYEDYFSNAENFKKIYTLNRKSLSFLQSGNLVHMRCMVQDMSNPEFFVSKYQTTNKTTVTSQQRTALYLDVLPQQADEDVVWCEDEGHQERHVFYCTPVPAETTWFRALENKKYCDIFETSCQSDRACNKRKLAEEDDDMGGGVEAENNGEALVEDDKMGKKQKVNNDEEDTTGKQYQNNLPLCHEMDIPAIIKVYDLKADLQLNDVVEVVGVLSLSSSVTPMDEGEEELMTESYPIHVPRIHVILLTKQPFISTSPVMMSGLRMQACKERLLSLLTTLLLGDHTAAVCLLCHLLSSVYVRHDVRPLGKLSINLHNFPQPAAPHVLLLNNFLNRLLAKCHSFDMTLDNMNKCRLVPSKDHQNNRLNSGILQLSKGTHLIIDETKLMPGKLDHTGIRNLSALSDALQWQRINYDFHFHTIPFNTDIRFLILSHAKSLLKTDLSIKIKQSPPPSPPSSSSSSSSSSLSWQHQFELLQRLLSEELWTELRCYVMSAQQVTFNIDDDVQKVLEEDFVEGRRRDDMSTEQMHSLLTLARYLSMSDGNGSLSQEHWYTAKRLVQDLQSR